MQGIASLDVGTLRRLFSDSDAKRDEGLTMPEDIEYLSGIPYGENGLTLDLCYPRAEGVYPTIVSVHGGGYVYGSAHIYRFYAADLARRGFNVVNYDYRLAPEHKFPAPLRDLSDVMLWLSESAGRYGLDTRNVFIVGDSAGAQIASQYAVAATNERYSEIMGIAPPSFPIRALGLNCGAYDPEARAKQGGLMAAYFTEDHERFGEMLKPLDYLRNNFPPAYLMTFGGDFARENCEPMAKLLMSRGVECEWKCYGDEKAGHVHHLDVRSSLGREANDDEIAFFIKHII